MRRLSVGLITSCLCLWACPQTPEDGPLDSGGNDPDAGAGDVRAGDVAETTPDATTVPTDAADTPDLSDGDVPAIRSIAAACPMTAIDDGTAWTGWGNLQFPLILELEVGEVSDPVFGQVWQEGVTDQPGMASGWEAELMVGPLGSNPVDQPGCFRALPADFNVDSDNNDEWWVRLQPDRAGLWGMFYRYRPPGGAWRYGDINGSDDGVDNANAAILAVDDPAGPEEIRVVTLNLRCRTDQWDVRFDLVVDALVAADPHVVGFQEDCSVPGETPQSYEIAAQLAERLDRGFEAFRLVTHQADHPEGTFDEGISLLSAFPIDAHFPLDLPSANFPRQALIADVRLGGGNLLRVINTHFDFGAANDGVRDQEAAALVAELGDGPTIVTGDFNTDPGDPAYLTLDAALDDVWTAVGVGDGNTIPADAPTRRIDYIWTLGLTPQTATIVDGESGGVHLSDHVGIAGTLAR